MDSMPSFRPDSSMSSRSSVCFDICITPIYANSRRTIPRLSAFPLAYPSPEGTRLLRNKRSIAFCTRSAPCGVAIDRIGILLPARPPYGPALLTDFCGRDQFNDCLSRNHPIGFTSPAGDSVPRSYSTPYKWTFANNTGRIKAARRNRFLPDADVSIS